MRGPSLTGSAFYFAMNNPNSEIQIEDTPAEPQSPETPSPEIQVAEVPQPEFQPLDMRRRLRELLSVPERDRSDEVWDEIIELEIQLAPGNRIAGNEPSANQPRHNQPRNNQSRHNQPRHGKPGGGAPVADSGGADAGAQQKKHRPRTKNNRRPRPGGKPGGGSGGEPV